MAVLPYEVYKVLEEEVGREKAEKIGKVIEEALIAIEKKAFEQKPILKAEIKDELTKELATKADIAETKAEIEKVRAEVEKVRAEVEKVRAEVEKVKAEVDKVKAEMDKVRAEVEKVRAEVEKVRAEVKVLEARVFAEFKLIRVWLIILTVLVAFFNRDALGLVVELLKLLK